MSKWWAILNDDAFRFMESAEGRPFPSNVQLSIYPDVISHKRVSFGSRKPDNVFRCRRDVAGPQSIVLIGENKGRYKHDYFPDEEIGHILDMAMSLMANYQKNRAFVYCFLTNGYNFQFFKVNKDRGSFYIEHSQVYNGLRGWQVI